VAEFLPWSSPFLLFRQESAHRPADYITLFGFGRNTYGSAVAFNHFTAAKLTSAARFHLAVDFHFTALNANFGLSARAG